MSALQAQTLATIKQFANKYASLYRELDATYAELQKGRAQFPVKFIGKQEIRIHLKQLTERNSKAQNVAEQKAKKLKMELDLIEKKLEEEADTEIKTKLEEDFLRSKNAFALAMIAARSSKKLMLEVTQERLEHFYEDLLLFSANCKHEALELHKMCMAVYDDAKNNVDYYSAFLLVEVAEDYMKEKGFQKISADIRTAYLNSRVELKELKTVCDRIESLKDISKKLLDAFEADEVNFRRFADRKNLVGL